MPLGPSPVSRSIVMHAVLNIGGGSKAIAIPRHYEGWKHDLLDIDPRGNPDIVRDARELETLPSGTSRAVYCPNNRDPSLRHDAVKVVRGFHHVLEYAGFAEIHVPDLAELFRTIALRSLDIDDVLYISGSGPILVRD